MARTLVYLVRHGEQRRAGAGKSDSGLSEVGREQAHLLGRRLRHVPFAEVHHSRLARATETAEVIAGYLPAVPVHACDRVMDRTPVPSRPQVDQYPERYRARLDAVRDDERDEDAGRIRAAVEHFGVAGESDRHELVITHNFVIGWFVRHALDAPVWRWIGLNQDNCGLTIVQWQTDHPPTLVCFNDVGHIPPELRGEGPLQLLS